MNTIKKITALILAVILVTAAKAPMEAKAAGSKNAQPKVTCPNAKITKKSTKAYSMTLEKGTKAKLAVKSSEKTITKKANYTSDKKSVASVSKSGVITAKKAGTAKIKVSYKGRTSTVTVKVTKKAAASNAADNSKLKRCGRIHDGDCVWKHVVCCRCGLDFNTSKDWDDHKTLYALLATFYPEAYFPTVGHSSSTGSICIVQLQ